jgi:hypothetical protein
MPSGLDCEDPTAGPHDALHLGERITPVLQMHEDAFASGV